MDEIWKDVVGYEGYYQVSNLGNIKSLDRDITYNNGVVVHTKGKIINGFIKSNGYKSVDLYLNAVRKKHHVHRLVAQAFIINPENKSQINHKDENRSNNCVDNLEWCTCSENQNYGSHKQKQRESHLNHPKLSKKVTQYDLSGKFMKVFLSISEAERETGIRGNSIVRCCKHHHNVQTCQGFRWEYYNDEVN